MRGKPNRSFAAVAVASLFVSGVAMASERVAVQPFSATGVESSLASIVESSFCTALVAESVDVLCPDALVALIQAAQTRAGLGASCGDGDAACLAGVARAAKASQVVTGDVARLESKFHLTVTLVDASSGKVLVRVTESAKKADALLEKLADVAKRVARSKG